MTKYIRNQSRVKGLALDTPRMRAAVNLVIAAKDGTAPEQESIDILADAFLEVFGGSDPRKILGGTLGLVPTPGRNPDYGFTPADIVSAVIEIERRRLGGGRGALAAAKRHAAVSFVDIHGAAASRSIERDWSAGRKTVEGLSDHDLAELVRPYKY